MSFSLNLVVKWWIFSNCITCMQHNQLYWIHHVKLWVAFLGSQFFLILTMSACNMFDLPRWVRCALSSVFLQWPWVSRRQSPHLQTFMSIKLETGSYNSFLAQHLEKNCSEKSDVHTCGAAHVALLHRLAPDETLRPCNSTLPRQPALRIVSVSGTSR